MAIPLAVLCTAIIAANTIALAEIIGSHTLTARQKTAWCFTVITGAGAGSILWYTGPTRKLHAPAMLILPDSAPHSPTMGEISRMHDEIAAYLQHDKTP